MFGFFSKLFSASNTSPRPSAARLGLESLEIRDTPSVSSPAIHAVSAPAGHVSANVVFSLGESDHLLRVGTLVVNGDVGTPANIQSLSAGHEANGFGDVFVLAGDGGFWQWKQGAWTELQGPGQVSSFAAVDGGRVYAIFHDQTLREFNGSAWFQVPNSGSVTKLDAITDAYGHDSIYVEKTDHSFGVLSAKPPLNVPLAAFNAKITQTTGSIPGGIVYTELAAPLSLPTRYGVVYTATVRDFSVGLDTSGHADVYATRFGSALQRNIGQTATGWANVAASGTYLQFSAADNGQVWVIDANSRLARYDNADTLHTLPNFGKTFVSLSAVGVNRDAGGNISHAEDVYAVATDGTLCEYYEDVNVTYGVFDQLSQPGAVRL